MTKSIIEMAREAGFDVDHFPISGNWLQLMKHYTELIKAAHLEELKQKQVPLTDEQIDELVGAAFDDYAWRGTTVMSRELARFIEKAHGIGEKE